MDEMLPAALSGLAELTVSIDHVGIAVADLDRAIGWWTTVMGFELRHREVNPDQRVAEAMLAAPGGGAEIQLLAPTDETSTIAKFLDRSGPGLQQLAVRVSDLEEACVRLRAHGIVPLYDTARRGTGGAEINFLHPRDTDGVLVELVGGIWANP